MNSSYRNPLHLYRALLRETTYFYQPFLQDFHAQYIRRSFRRQQGALPNLENGETQLPSRETVQQARRGRKYLRMLQRANKGHMGAIENVLWLAYARKGRRRRELVKDIMIAPPADPDTETGSLEHIKLYSEAWKPPVKFTMLLNNQTRIHSHTDVAGKLALMPKIPEKNKWLKPFPVSRIKGIYQKWYSKQAGKLLPPISESEWLHLYKNSTNQQGEQRYRTISRRSSASVPVLASLGSDATFVLPSIASLALTSAQKIEPSLSSRVSFALGNPHNLTPRYLRRRMQSVLRNTPTILCDSDTGRLASRWEPAIEPPQKAKDCTSSLNMVLFE